MCRAGDTGLYQLRVIVENADKKCREQFQKSPHEHGVCYAGSSNETDGLSHFVISPFAVVKAHDRGGAVGESLYRHGTDIPTEFNTVMTPTYRFAPRKSAGWRCMPPVPDCW